MRIKLGWVMPIICAALLAGVVATPIHAQENNDTYQINGHTVRGEFLAFYNSSPEKNLLYGYPITDEFIDIYGRKTQYFQKARFDYDPTAPEGKRIKLASLGALVYQLEKLTPVDNLLTRGPECTPYSSKEYGTFYVCYAFRDFFNRHGGLAQFGYPITNYVKEGNQYVQYFERARFEYQPEWSSRDWVKLTAIGWIQFHNSGNDKELLNKNADDNSIQTIPRKVTSLQARAFVNRAVITRNSSQTLYVVALDNKAAVEGAAVRVTLRFPDGTEEISSLPATNKDGISMWKFNVTAQQPNQVYLVSVTVSYGELSTTTSIWFRTWW
jgi:hypothetical protein